MGPSAPPDARLVTHVATAERLHITIRVSDLLNIPSTDPITRGTEGSTTEGKLLLFESYNWLDLSLQVTLRLYPNENGESIPKVEYEVTGGPMPEPIRILLQFNDEEPCEGEPDDENTVIFPAIRIEGDFDTIDVIFEHLEQDQVA
jgi:hypothetical protein